MTGSISSIHRCFVFAGIALGLAPVLFVERTCGQDAVEPRSPAQSNHLFSDELDQPRFTHRESHRGWEVRDAHLVVTSTRSPEEAEQVARELQRTWQRIEATADFWTDVHRRPGFATGAIAVLVGDESGNGFRPAPGPRATNEGTEIYIALPQFNSENRGGSTTAAHAEAIVDANRELARSFFRASGLEQRLPSWVQEGFAESWARPREQTDPFAEPTSASRNGAPANPLARPKVVEFRAGQANDAAPNAGNAIAEDTVAGGSALQTNATPASDAELARFVIERAMFERDGMNAAEFVARVAQISASPTSPPVLQRGALAVMFSPNAGNTAPEPLLEREPLAAAAEPFVGLSLVQREALNREVAKWNALRWNDQPVLKLDSSVDESVVEVAREQVVVWKLWYRLARKAAPSAPRVTVFNHGTQVDISPAARRELPDWQRFVERVLGGGEGPWATVDGQGQLLWSHERERLGRILAIDEPGAMRFDWYEGKPALARLLPDGQTLWSWFDQERGVREKAHGSRRRLQVRVVGASVAVRR